MSQSSAWALGGAGPADTVSRLPIRGRMLAMGVLAAVGGVTFLPFLAAGNGQPIARLIPFALVVTLVATLAAWPGLRCADATGLPMPLLRRLDGPSAGPIPRRAIGVTLVSSVGLGLLGLLALHLVDAPPVPGSVAVRALSAIFAAGPLEIVLHLGAMSTVVWLARGRRAPGIVVAATLLVVFHLAGGGLDQPGRLIALIVVANGAIGLVLGWIYAAYGFELVMLGHAVAHVITVAGAR
ncbi:MAG TPA: hypothetical protein VL308_03175 [Gemmatimonadaceae bacterium]|jgi:hypothetical protein|nr:hypothetical protein [Gemmatimonadaceae bacterium]